MQTKLYQGQREQVSYSAAVFRLLLDSLARPGKINQLDYPGFLGEPPEAANLYALGALLTLLDGEVTFAVAANGQWLDQSAEVVRWLALRSNAQIAEPAQADFALFCDGKSGGLISELNVGSMLEPEISTTAIYCVKQLVAGQEPSTSAEIINLELMGAGIQDRRMVKVTGLERTEIELIKATRQNYPLGIDVYLIGSAGQCVGLPRTTRINFSPRRHGDTESS